MKYIRTIVCPVLLTVVLLLAVRGLLVNHVRMPADAAVEGFAPRQHLLVSLTYYGLRLPGETLWGYHRWGYRVPAKGDPVLFYLPWQKGQPRPGLQAVGFCRALPGDTVWIDSAAQKILPARTSSGAQPLVIPGRNRKVKITPYNAKLYAFILRTYEHTAATVDARRRLMIRDVPLTHLTTCRDYYWMETRPGAYVLVPHDALVGKIIYGYKTKARSAK